MSETVDAWGRQMVYAVLLTAFKKPKVPEAIVQIEHPGRRSPETAPARRRDENGRVPAQFDQAKAARFFGAPSRA